MCTAKHVFILFLFPVIIYSQYSISPLRRAAFNGDVKKIIRCENYLFMAGSSSNRGSFIAVSADTGASWKINSESFAPADNLSSLSFVSRSIGYTGGAGGKMYKTTNGGISWSALSDTLLYRGTITDVYFPTPDTGFFCGPVSSGSILFKTCNGGSRWSPVSTPITHTPNAMLWTDRLHGWIVCVNSKILRTDDGGLSWSVTTPAASPLYCICRVSDSVFFAAGNALVLKSTNCGVSFFPLTAPAAAVFNSCQFTDESHGFVFGADGAAFETSDGGINWQRTDALTSETINTSVIHSNNIIIGGARSTICRFNTSRHVWESLANDSRDYYSVFSNAPSSMVITGDKGNVCISTDGGRYWQPTRSTGCGMLYDCIKNGSDIYICGRLGAFAHSGNNGLSWFHNTVGTGTTRNTKLQLSSPNSLFMVSGDGTVYHSTDKGITWNLKNTIFNAALNNMQMLSDTLGYVIGTGLKIYRSSDFGSTWSHDGLADLPETLFGIFMLNRQQGYVCGENGAVFKTSDGFHSVILLTDTNALHGKTLYSITAFNESDVWAVGSDGVILHSASPQKMILWDSIGTDIYSITKTSESSLAACGAGGSVFRIGIDIVPALLVGFSASETADGVLFRWRTAAQKDLRRFVIEFYSGGIWHSLAAISPCANEVSVNEYEYRYSSKDYIGHLFRLCMESFDGSTQYSVSVNIYNAPVTADLLSNYPNPFNPETIIRYRLNQKCGISVRVYDLLGRLVQTMVNREQDPGEYNVNWRADIYPAGIYICELKAGGLRLTRKMLLLR